MLGTVCAQLISNRLMGNSGSVEKEPVPLQDADPATTVATDSAKAIDSAVPAPEAAGKDALREAYFKNASMDDEEYINALHAYVKQAENDAEKPEGKESGEEFNYLFFWTGSADENVGDVPNDYWKSHKPYLIRRGAESSNTNEPLSPGLSRAPSELEEVKRVRLYLEANEKALQTHGAASIMPSFFNILSPSEKLTISDKVPFGFGSTPPPSQKALRQSILTTLDEEVEPEQGRTPSAAAASPVKTATPAPATPSTPSARLVVPTLPPLPPLPVMPVMPATPTPGTPAAATPIAQQDSTISLLTGRDSIVISPYAAVATVPDALGAIGTLPAHSIPPTCPRCPDLRRDLDSLMLKKSFADEREATLRAQIDKLTKASAVNDAKVRDLNDQLQAAIARSNDRDGLIAEKEGLVARLGEVERELRKTLTNDLAVEAQCSQLEEDLGAANKVDRVITHQASSDITRYHTSLVITYPHTSQVSRVSPHLPSCLSLSLFSLSSVLLLSFSVSLHFCLRFHHNPPLHPYSSLPPTHVTPLVIAATEPRGCPQAAGMDTRLQAR